MKLTRPLVTLDLETTGTWIEKDRIIEIGMIRLEPDGDQKIFNQRVNPGMPIPAVVSELTGISNDDVKDSPKFKEIAQSVLDFLAGADLAGFNLERFDLPVLAREFSEIGIDFRWKERAVYDAQKVYHLNEKRDLTAAYAFYCGKPLEDAHSALADSQATLEILESQVAKYGEGDDTVDVLGKFEYNVTSDYYDADRRFRWWNGELYMMFGKYARKKTLKQIACEDPRYLEWIMSANFSQAVKDLCAGALDGKFPVYQPAEQNEETETEKNPRQNTGGKDLFPEI
ncbi:MAG: exonuclease domain-containing protein [Candidatus Omnitrophota bacterium]